MRSVNQRTKEKRERERRKERKGKRTKVKGKKDLIGKGEKIFVRIEKKPDETNITLWADFL